MTAQTTGVGFRTSVHQQRLLDLAGDPATSPFLAEGRVRLEGEVDAERLRAALGEVIARHEILRARFLAGGNGSGVVQVADAAEASLETADLEGLSDDARRRRCDELADALRRRAASLDGVPRLHAVLTTSSRGLHTLHLAVPAVCGDTVTLGVLTREVLETYAGDGPRSPSDGLQYIDFSEWHRQLLAEGTEDRRRPWDGLDPGTLRSATLPFERRGETPVDGWEPASLEVELDGSLGRRVTALSGELGCPPATLILACWWGLLGRLRDDRPPIVGIGMPGRQLEELEAVAGLFERFLPLAVDLGLEAGLAEAARELGAALDETADQQEYFDWRRFADPLPAEDLALPFLFAFREGGARGSAGGLDYEVERLEVRLEPFKVRLEAAPAGGSYRLRWSYDPRLYTRRAAICLADQLTCLLEHAVAEPAASLRSLPLLGREARRQVLAEAQRRGDEYPRDSTVARLIAEQARATPDAVAVESPVGCLTYAGLEELSSVLAGRLQRAGVDAEGRVGIYMERSPGLVVCLLAVLKAGGAYVPLDPAFPAERLAVIRDDAKIGWLLTEPSLRGTLEEDGVEVWCPRFEALGEPPASAGTRGAFPAGDNLAYVIFTSGSTGRPKGVQVTHRALVNFLWSMRREPGLGRGDRLLAVTTLSFDIAALELFLPLLVGACVVVAPAEAVIDAPPLIEALAHGRPTLVQATPATWQMLVSGSWAGDPGLKVLCGGEALAGDLAGQLLERSAGVWNMYGPTETTVWSAAGRVEAGESPIRLGGPIANTDVYVLDADLRPVAAGLPGEVLLGGDGLARGYLDRPALTAQVFVPDPLGGGEGARLYRTGDLARRWPEGDLEFLGRADHQVKVRGFRIELGEIETALRSHPRVREAVAVAHGEGVDRRLLGYVVESEPATTDAELREFLWRRLPDYMVPLTYVRLESIPRTPNRKVDRRALPAPEATRAAYVAPRDAVEGGLARIFEHVLEVDRVGIRDDFFALGGHSFLAVRLLARIEEEMSQQLELPVLLEGATVEYLADRIRRQEGRPFHSALVPIRAEGTKPPLFLVHPAGGTVLGFNGLTRHLPADRPVYGIQDPNLYGVQHEDTSIGSMAKRYVEAIRTVQDIGPFHIGGSSLGGVIAYEMARQLRDAGEEVGVLAFLDTVAPVSGAIPDLPDDAGWVLRFAKVLAWHYNVDLPVTEEEIRPLELRAMLDYILEHAVSRKIVSADMNAETFWRFFLVYRANFEDLARYAIQPSPGRIVLFRATETHPQEREKEAVADDPSLGWSHFSDDVEIVDIPGDHMQMLRGDHVRTVADRLESLMEP